MHHIELDKLRLGKGSHDDPTDGLCVMEAVAYWASEPHTDRPACVSTVLIDFGQNLNDRLPDDKRQRLIPLVPPLVGTRGDGLDEARGYLALDWLIRTYTPAWLDLAGLSAEAQELRALRRIADMAAAEAAGPVVRSARSKAAAAWDAAWDAARAAAGAAAGDAARPHGRPAPGLGDRTLHADGQARRARCGLTHLRRAPPLRWGGGGASAGSLIRGWRRPGHPRKTKKAASALTPTALKHRITETRIP